MSREHYGILDHKDEVIKAIVGLTVGDLVGEGAHRRVYAMLGDPSRVLKVERFEHEFMNVAEWRTWDELQWDPRARVWLAPCHQISGEGLVLVQERVRDLTDKEWASIGPVPAWLGDTKRDNWGWYEEPGEPGRAVMRDYGLNKGLHLAAGLRRTVPKHGDE